MPAFIHEALERAGLTAAYDERPDYQRNDYISWITRGVREDTRQRRLAQMLDELRAGDVYMRMAWRQGIRPRRAGPIHPPAKSVDAYLANLTDASQRTALEKLRAHIKTIIPDAVEVISYGIPMFKLNSKPVVAYSANKNGCSLHTMHSDVKGEFAPDLDGYSTTKEAVHFKPDAPLPQPLLERIVKALVARRAAE